MGRLEDMVDSVVTHFEDRLDYHHTLCGLNIVGRQNGPVDQRHHTITGPIPTGSVHWFDVTAESYTEHSLSWVKCKVCRREIKKRKAKHDAAIAEMKKGWKT